MIISLHYFSYVMDKSFEIGYPCPEIVQKNDIINPPILIHQHISETDEWL